MQAAYLLFVYRRAVCAQACCVCTGVLWMFSVMSIIS